MRNHLFLGVSLTLLGAFFYACQTALIKAMALQLPPLPVVIFGQSAIALIIALPFVFLQGRHKLSVKRLPMHFLRSLFSLGISYLLFYAVRFIPLVNGMLLVNTAPIIVPFLAYFFLGQRIAHQLWLPIFIGFLGVGFVLHPSLSAFSSASLLALAAGVCMAASILSVRVLGTSEGGMPTMFWFLLLSTLISGVVAIFFWQAMTGWALFIMCIVGVLYFFTQYMLTCALGMVSAQLVASLYYVTVIYAAIFSFFIWHVTPNYFTMFGILLVISGGVLCILAERKVRQQSLLLEGS